MTDKSDTTTPDILERLKIYEQYGPLSSLAIHPETPGYSTGRLFGDARHAAAEIKRLRVQNKRLTERLRKAGLLGDLVEALNGDEQMERNDVR